MDMQEDFLDQIDEVAERDGRYQKAAYLFIYDALQHTVGKLGKTGLTKEQRHVSGRELLSGISEHGLSQFGPLTRSVFNSWGVRTTQDFGEIVFTLVQSNLMSKTAEDDLVDFTDVYDFAEEFNWKKRKADLKRPS